MIQFDPENPRSSGAGTLHHTALLLSKQPAFWAISETTALTASQKIVTGIHQQPWDGGRYTKQQLAEIFCEAQIYPPVPSEAITQQDDGGPTPLTGGVHELFIRRFVRPVEISSHEDRNGLFLGFYDHICWLEASMIEQAEQDGCPRIPSIEPICEGAFGQLSETSAQGEYLWARLRILWGDLEQ